MSTTANITIDGVTQAENTRFRLPTGNYNITTRKSGYFSQKEEYSIAPATNNTISFYNLSNAKITLNLFDVYDGSAISIYSGTMNQTTYGVKETKSTTNGSVSFFGVQGLNYLFSTDGAALTITNTSLIPTQQNTTLTLYGQKVNSVNVSIFDAGSGLSFNGTNVTITLALGGSTIDYYTTTGNYYFYNLSVGVYTFTISAVGFNPNNHIITITNRSSQSLNSYLVNLSSSSAVVFTFKDLNTDQTVSGATITITKRIMKNCWLLQPTSNFFLLSLVGWRCRKVRNYLCLCNKYYHLIVRLESRFGIQIWHCFQKSLF
jgi:hypothetical protein